jgi:RNA polymerase sigma-70 factor (ECF subfamily)
LELTVPLTKSVPTVTPERRVIVATNIYTAFPESHRNFEGDLVRYSKMLYRTAFRRVGNPADAEDAVQDAWLSAWKHSDQFEGRAQFSTWLTRIVINAAGSQLRRKSRRQIVSLDQTPHEEEISLADQLRHNGPSAEDIYEDNELREMVHGSLKALSPILRVAVQLVDLDGQSIQEAASTLNIGIPALKSRLSRARAKLATILRLVFGGRMHREPTGGLGHHSVQKQNSMPCGICDIDLT